MLVAQDGVEARGVGTYAVEPEVGGDGAPDPRQALEIREALGAVVAWQLGRQALRNTLGKLGQASHVRLDFGRDRLAREGRRRESERRSDQSPVGRKHPASLANCRARTEAATDRSSLYRAKAATMAA